MTIDELFTNLAHSGISLFIEGDRLRYRAPEGALTADVRAAISEYRLKIVERLRARQSTNNGSRTCVTCDRQYWADDPPKNGRIRTSCSKCGRFIGYRPEGF